MTLDMHTLGCATASRRGSRRLQADLSGSNFCQATKNILRTGHLQTHQVGITAKR